MTTNADADEQRKEPLPTGGNVIFVATVEIRMEVPQNKMEIKLNT